MIHFKSPFCIEKEKMISVIYDENPVKRQELSRGEKAHLLKYHYLCYEFTINNADILTERLYQFGSHYGEIIKVHAFEEGEKERYLSYMFDLFCVEEYGKYTLCDGFVNEAGVYQDLEKKFEYDEKVELGTSFMTNNWLIRDKKKKIPPVKFMLSHSGHYYIINSTQTSLDHCDFGKNHYKKRAKLRVEQYMLIQAFKERLKKQRLRMLMNL